LGSRLVRIAGSSVRIGRVVEVEAYIGTEDEACHARFGPTPRNAVMFGPPGHAYVYLVYGMYHCLNVVTEIEGRAAALLVRAVEPIEGMDQIRAVRREWLDRRHRGGSGHAPAGVAAEVASSRLASGPGLVCLAFSIDRSDNGVDLCEGTSDLHLEPGGVDPAAVATGPRIGIGYAGEPWRSAPWRFWIAGNVAVSARGARQ
jgi:DNA-3-methyladenine glycosylase